MIERAIENWLTETNERNFKLPFCQALAHQGHTLVFISADRPMEQGKDVITIDPAGEACAYQLKGENIGLDRWRTEVRPQIEELIQLPIVHPKIDKSRGHKSYLVLNGDITDEVRIQIDNINEDNVRKGRGYSHLDVINLHQLLKMLLDAQGRFVPRKLQEFKSFLELFLAPGNAPLDKVAFFSFLNKTLFAELHRQKADRLNAISSSVILTAYAMKEFEQRKNHFALFEAWTALAASIVRYASRAGLDKDDWAGSLDLAMLEIRRALRSLEDEAISREVWIEGQALGDGGDTLRARTTLVIGSLSAAALDRCESAGQGQLDRNILNLIRTRQKHLWYWGESAFPYFFSISKYLEACGEISMSLAILRMCLEAVLQRNAPRSNDALPSPYYSPGEILERNHGVRPEIDPGESIGSSYTLKLAISALVRRNEREYLTAMWRRISHVRFREFQTDQPLDWLLWHADTGTNKSWYPNQTQKWSELAAQAAREAEHCPPPGSEYRGLLRFFTLVVPHRICDPVVSLLDQAPQRIAGG